MVALKTGETISVSVDRLQEMSPALDPDSDEPESEPHASGDPGGMERHCLESTDVHMAVDSDSDVHMAVDSDSPVPTPTRSRDEPLHAADLERGELEEERP